MTDTQEAMREFHAWNEELSGNENQEICKYRMQGWMGHAAQSAEKMAAMHKAILQGQDEIDLRDEKIARLEAEKAMIQKVADDRFAIMQLEAERLAAAELSNKQLRDLRYELAGIAADVDAGKGFDIVCRKTLRRVMDALAQQPSTEALDAYVAKLNKWQPIETAPKDGRFLLGVWEGNWDNPKQEFSVYQARQHSGGMISWAMRGQYRTEEGGAYEIAGWMPLPPAPKE